MRVGRCVNCAKLTRKVVLTSPPPGNLPYLTCRMLLARRHRGEHLRMTGMSPPPSIVGNPQIERNVRMYVRMGGRAGGERVLGSKLIKQGEEGGGGAVRIWVRFTTTLVLSFSRATSVVECSS